MAAMRRPLAPKTSFPPSCVGIMEIKVARKAFIRVCIALWCQSKRSPEEPARKCHLNVRPANTPVGHKGAGVVHSGLDFTMDTGAYTHSCGRRLLLQYIALVGVTVCPRARATQVSPGTLY